MNKNSAQVIAYADDVVIIARTKKELETATLELEKKAKLIGLRMNEENTAVKNDESYMRNSPAQRGRNILVQMRKYKKDIEHFTATSKCSKLKIVLDAIYFIKPISHKSKNMFLKILKLK